MPDVLAVGDVVIARFPQQNPQGRDRTRRGRSPYRIKKSYSLEQFGGLE